MRPVTPSGNGVTSDGVPGRISWGSRLGPCSPRTDTSSGRAEADWFASRANVVPPDRRCPTRPMSRPTRSPASPALTRSREVRPVPKGHGRMLPVFSAPLKAAGPLTNSSALAVSMLPPFINECSRRSSTDVVVSRPAGRVRRQAPRYLQHVVTWRRSCCLGIRTLLGRC